MFKAAADGVEVFPNIPSLIKPAVKKWKLNQETVLLRVLAGDSYTKVLEHMKSQKVSIQPTQVSRPIRVPAPLSDNLLLRKMPPPHVPPLCAPNQSETAPMQSSDQGIGRCAYWPKCKLNRSVCNDHIT